MLKSYLYSLTDSPRLAHIYTYIENTQFTKINNSVLMLIYAKTIERGLTNQYLFLFNKSRDSNCCHKFFLKPERRKLTVVLSPRVQIGGLYFYDICKFIPKIYSDKNLTSEMYSILSDANQDM